MTRTFVHSILALALVAALIPGEGQAASAEDFYKGKRMTLIVASGAGGGYDIYARTLARHLVKHIPGTPSIVVQNMDGASGLRATNFVANKSPRDGSVFLATYNSLGIQPLYDKKAIEYDPLTLNWLGSIGKLENICVTWGSNPIKTLAQAKGKDMVTSSTGARSNTTMVPNLLNKLVGTNFRPLIGYSTGGMRLALEQGEVDALCGLAYSTLMASNPDWIMEKKVNILAQITRKPVPTLGDAPVIYDLASGAETKKILDLWTVPQEMGRPFVAPPDVPQERVEALRRAFDATMKDPEFLAEAKRVNLFVDPMSGEEMTDLIQDAYKTPKDVIQKTADIIKYAAYTKKK